MKYVLTTLGVALTVSVTSLCADSLSNSLNGMLKQKDTSGMVNLNSINVNGKPKRQRPARPVFRGRPGKTIIGHYNDNKPVYKKEADKYIKKVTKGKIKDLDMLPKKQRLLVLADLQKIYAMEHFKSRSPKAIIATVNGMNIRKKEANAYLNTVTKGKVKDFDRLDKKQQQVVISDLARPMVIKDAVNKDISTQEKEEIFKQMWLEKQKASMSVLPEEMLAFYENKKAQILAQNPQTQIPPYISLGDRLKKEILEQKIMEKVMKDVNITINYDINESLETKEKE
jgi:2-C-methyl-D-erythritol 4-phosphate cytidylyltransferase